MWSRENFAFTAVALCTGYALWTLFSLKVWADVYVAAPPLEQLKPPVLALLLLFLISFLNWRNIEPLLWGTLVGIPGGIAFFLWFPSPSVTYRGVRLQALANLYGGYLALGQTVAMCAGYMIAVMVIALLSASLLKYFCTPPAPKEKRRLQEQ